MWLLWSCGMSPRIWGRSRICVTVSWDGPVSTSMSLKLNEDTTWDTLGTLPGVCTSTGLGRSKVPVGPTLFWSGNRCDLRVVMRLNLKLP